MDAAYEAAKEMHSVAVAGDVYFKQQCEIR